MRGLSDDGARLQHLPRSLLRNRYVLPSSRHPTVSAAPDGGSEFRKSLTYSRWNRFFLVRVSGIALCRYMSCLVICCSSSRRAQIRQVSIYGFLRNRLLLNPLDFFYSGIIASVITLPRFKELIGNPANYDSLSGAVVSTFTGPFARVQLLLSITLMRHPQVAASLAQR